MEYVREISFDYLRFGCVRVFFAACIRTTSAGLPDWSIRTRHYPIWTDNCKLAIVHVGSRTNREWSCSRCLGFQARELCRVGFSDNCDGDRSARLRILLLPRADHSVWSGSSGQLHGYDKRHGNQRDSQRRMSTIHGASHRVAWRGRGGERAGSHRAQVASGFGRAASRCRRCDANLAPKATFDLRQAISQLIDGRPSRTDAHPYSGWVSPDFRGRRLGIASR